MDDSGLCKYKQNPLTDFKGYFAGMDWTLE